VNCRFWIAAETEFSAQSRLLADGASVISTKAASFESRCNPFMEFALSAKNCLILALSAKLCRSDESAIELGYFSLSAKLCRFWRPLIAVSHTNGSANSHLLARI
jgi:hypothetical protein